MHSLLLISRFHSRILQPVPNTTSVDERRSGAIGRTIHFVPARRSEGKRKATRNEPRFTILSVLFTISACSNNTTVRSFFQSEACRSRRITRLLSAEQQRIDCSLCSFSRIPRPLSPLRFLVRPPAVFHRVFTSARSFDPPGNFSCTALV